MDTWVLVVVDYKYEWRTNQWITTAYMCHPTKPESYDVVSFQGEGVFINTFV